MLSIIPGGRKFPVFSSIPVFTGSLPNHAQSVLILIYIIAVMSGYKLYYFNVRGRAEICRLAFAAANITYEDIRLNDEEWVKEKECK